MCVPPLPSTLREWKLACPKTEGDLVFPGGVNGKILRTDDVHRRCWRPLLRSLGLEDSDGPRYTFHSLRHVAASLMIESGMQPKKLQAIMGHSSIKLTYDVYGHLWASA
jgi:integrase